MLYKQTHYIYIIVYYVNLTQIGVPYLTYDTFTYRLTEILVTTNANGGASHHSD